MSVLLTRAYGGFPASATIPVVFPDVTEQALIAQGWATPGPASSLPAAWIGQSQVGSMGGNTGLVPNTGVSQPASYQGPLNLPCFSLGSAALSGYETAGVAPVAGTMNLTEIYVPYVQTWTGIGKLNGTTIGTDNHLVALYGSNGALLASSAVAGVLAANASVFQNIPFTVPITLLPGRYFLGVQSNGTTATLRHILAANGSNICTGTQAGVFGTIPTTLTTIPVTFTTAVGVITQLYV